ncbi:hypothetical protein ACFY4B_26800 [Kitasatospora sp. NPDC001261]|uniref:hypothetical protein n=1 Tax=Kitasatospora sp. NPDC001261 TaxID=3364012 RepID=UPI00368B4871
MLNKAVPSHRTGKETEDEIHMLAGKGEGTPEAVDGVEPPFLETVDEPNVTAGRDVRVERLVIGHLGGARLSRQAMSSSEPSHPRGRVGSVRHQQDARDGVVVARVPEDDVDGTKA